MTIRDHCWRLTQAGATSTKRTFMRRSFAKIPTWAKKQKMSEKEMLVF
jgi:hypothetical protein